MLKKLLALVGAMSALLGLSGCLELESTISVNKDGSGTLTEKAVMGAQMVAMMNMGAAQGGEDPLANFSEESLKKKAATYGEGVEFAGVKKEEKDGGLTVTATFKIADISKFKFSPGSLMADGEDIEEEAVEMFAMKDGVLTIMVPDPSEEELAFGDEEMSEEEMMMAAPMMAGFKMSATLVCEGGIESTNATYHEDNSVVLMSMNFDELMKNEGGLAVMKNLKAESREEFAKKVEGIKGLQMESQEKVTVELK